ncbi:fumarate reductase subunit C [Chromobacterium subtsugae]|uniref:Fumarate reductase subunit C n=1 Tax=Chromobacterium subtsugae TaxID=251747 RepID=A0ABS7FAB4_9NEIS|nr:MULTISPECIES: fumarate reductase [Chromobacterium]KUM04549.1 fumarate reductase [Chromobacterium subtsugae]KZE87118.1 fumarate reductase [Chromobacterium sp. F49]MBW7565938.1 fumarate reductase subunit C [Chromobacterium subtsugae]MBW8287022.1 fumarate reductase subunit C [Chromobacterium subtsugae]OBU88206.1 fumarate reductase [Chromobacterium subtsugae]
MNKRRPYVRPMGGWWRKSPYFIEYMVHEGTALFVAAYAFALLFGLWRLSQGEAAWNGFIAALRSPWSVLCHLILFLMIGYHSYTWFKIMPRTLPPLIIGGKRVSAAAITAGGFIAALLASLALLGIAWGISQ